MSKLLTFYPGKMTVPTNEEHHCLTRDTERITDDTPNDTPLVGSQEPNESIQQLLESYETKASIETQPFVSVFKESQFGIYKLEELARKERKWVQEHRKGIQERIDLLKSQIATLVE